ALEDGDAVASELRLDHLDLARHDRLRPKDQILHRDLILDRVTPPVEDPLPQTAQVQDGFPKRLARDRSRVHAHTAHRSLPYDDGDFATTFGSADCAFLAGRSAADHEEVELVCIHRGLVSKCGNFRSNQNLIPLAARSCRSGSRVWLPELRAPTSTNHGGSRTHHLSVPDRLLRSPPIPPSTPPPPRTYPAAPCPP